MLDSQPTMWGSIHLDAKAETPLYRQLYEHIHAMMRSGTLVHGDRLPPTRELAGRLGLNRTTVSAAYELLETDGLIQGHVGRGSFVNLPQYIEATPEEQIISFASSRPAAAGFPLSEFQACCREVASGPDATAILQLGSPAGYPPLRRYLLEQANREGAARAGDDTIITNGCQQALDLIARVIARPDSAVIVEDPVYHGLKNVFARAGARLIGIPAGENGIDAERLARALSAEGSCVIVVNPNFQNPTGGTMGLQQRCDLVRLAQEQRCTLVENDLYGELRYDGEPLPTLKQLDTTGSTILIRSFSKIAFPGLRVGWVTGPSKVVAELTAARQWCDLHTDQLSQAVLWRFAASGRLGAHLKRMRASGRERLRAAIAACERCLPPGASFTRPLGGMNLWVRLPGGLDAAALLPRAETEGVTYLPGTHFAVSSYDPGAFRLSFGGLSPEQIDSGVAILGRIFTEALGGGANSGRLDASLALV